MSDIVIPSEKRDYSDKIETLKERVRLLGDRILVWPHDEPEKKTASGLVIVKDPRDEVTPTEGTVLLVGTKIERKSLEDEHVEAGEIVIYSKYAGYDVTVDNVTYKCLRITDVIGALKG